MEGSKYLDFDLAIERMRKNTYRARVLDSPAGIAKAEFSLPLSDLEIENFVLKVGRMRRTVRRIGSPEMQAAKDFGSKLYKAIFSDEVQSALRSSMDQARAQGSGLRIRLHLNDAPELVDIPWEYLYNPSLNRFLALSVNTPIVRYLELPENIRPFAVKPPLRVLVMIANPKDYAALDVENEWQNLKKAVSDLEAHGLLILERLETATPVALQYRLRCEDFHIFHFIGHGGFDEGAQDGLLMLESENGLGKPLSGQYLGTILHDEDSLRLVVLNACEGARTGKNDPFAGAAQSLVQQGLPAVIAMQFEVSDQAAITFAHEFYAALADGFPVDAALSEARKVIFSSGNEIEWGTPVLYLRTPDGQIFDIVQPASVMKEERLIPFQPTTSTPGSSPIEIPKEPVVEKQLDNSKAIKSQTSVLPKRQVNWLAVAFITLGIWIGWVLLEYWIGNFIWESFSFALLFGAGSGLAIGLGMITAIRRLGFNQERKNIITSLLAWMGGFGILFVLISYVNQASVDTSDILLMSLLALILFSVSILPGTLASVAGLSTGQSGFRWNTVWLLSLGWLLGIIIPVVILYLYNQNADSANTIVFYSGGGLIGLIVGVWTQYQLRKIEPAVHQRIAKPEAVKSKAAALPKTQVNWLAVGAITLGIWIGWALLIYWADQFIWESLSVALLFGAGSGLAIGLGMSIAIRRLGFHQERKLVATSILAWVGGFGIVFLLLRSIQESVDTSDILLMSLLLLILFSLSILPGTLANIASLQNGKSGFRWNTVWLLAAGWLVGILVTIAILYLYNQNADSANDIVFYSGGGLAGLVVGVWTQWALRKSENSDQIL